MSTCRVRLCLFSQKLFLNGGRDRKKQQKCPVRTEISKKALTAAARRLSLIHISPSFMVSPVASCALPSTVMRVPFRYAPSAFPVSYTHLHRGRLGGGHVLIIIQQHGGTVFLRQPPDGPDQRHMCIRLRVRVRPGPVSYTHLDLLIKYQPNACEKAGKIL